VRFDLKCATDIAVYAIFDPVAMLHVINNPELDHMGEDVVASDIEQGNLLVYSWGSDGGTTFRVFVDEEPDEEAVAQSTARKSDMLLRLPSGTLFAAGMEYLCRPGEEPIAAEQFESAVQPLGESASVPAANYLADAFEIRQREREVGPFEQVFGTVACLGCLGSAFATLCAILVPLAGVALRKDWRNVWFYWAVVMGLVWLPVIIAGAIIRFLPSHRQFDQRQKELRKRFAFDAVIALRRLPEDADLSGLRGGCFGSAYAD